MINEPHVLLPNINVTASYINPGMCELLMFTLTYQIWLFLQSSKYRGVVIGRGLHHILFEVIMAGALNFKMASSGSVSVTEEAMNMIKKIQFQIAQKMLGSFE